ncbi:4-hydroxy-tetrahydrodipicolinate synthase [Propioniferax innocua]|uniref:4-hydroxy-tetrahydrodipicolinate synthase n=1 Tax=Propioniferax innocua TaxID=1753 RepID=A0A542ZRC9_9ACTN|nr:4-hydroxy-tetrahydrodipicolinate synthase [Propioniferax innocua]TQL62914.1 4-hydroxy-tetrahydrodipicolinate synthase [Propioniferax innocua]
MRSYPFGTLVTAMVTPFDDDLALDLPAAAELAVYLVEEMHNDALVISGTTGESPTTTWDEKSQLVRTVREAVGDDVKLIAGAGAASTSQSVELAKRASDNGADAVLLVAPYYARPPQSGIIAHFETVADATDLGVFMYDIPHRTGVPMTTDTLVTLGQHPNIVALKDAKHDMAGTAEVLRRTDLAVYSGDDAMTLPLLAIGGSGVVGTSTHFCGVQTKQMIEAYLAGDVERALELHRTLLPVYTGVFAAQGCTMVKAGLTWQGHRVGVLRPPQVAATEDQLKGFIEALEEAGLA